ncbi:hypothetical protein Hanom_Chr00s190177g01834591 [Helianthus anomalus]
MEIVISQGFKTSINRFVIKYDSRRRVMVKTVNAILNMEEVEMRILELGIPMDNLCEQTQIVMRRLSRKFLVNNANQFDEKPIISSWRYDDEYKWVTVMWNNGQEEDHTIDNILTKQGLSFIEKLCNATCLIVEMTPTVTSLEGTFQWRRQALEDAVKNEDEDEHFG